MGYKEPLRKIFSRRQKDSVTKLPHSVRSSFATPIRVLAISDAGHLLTPATQNYRRLCLLQKSVAGLLRLEPLRMPRTSLRKGELTRINKLANP